MCKTSDFLKLAEREADRNGEFRPNLFKHRTHERGRFRFRKRIGDAYIYGEGTLRIRTKLLGYTASARKHN